MIHVERFDGDRSQLPRAQFQRFVGKLSSNWPHGGIEGMSGGPVFGINADTGEYGVVAVQSGWLAQQRITFACPVTVFSPRLMAALRARGK